MTLSFLFIKEVGADSAACHTEPIWMKIISDLRAVQWWGDGSKPTCSGLKGRRIEKLFQILQKCKLKETKWHTSSDNGIYRIRYIILPIGKVEYENPTLNKW